MKKIALLLLASPLMAQNLKTAPADLKKLHEVDLGTLKPLVIARDGVYVCPTGFDMYVKVPENKSALVKVEPLKQVRIISDDKHKVLVVCVSLEQ